MKLLVIKNLSRKIKTKKNYFPSRKSEDVFFLFPYYIFGLYFPKVTKKPEKNNVLLLYDHWKVTPEPIVLQKQIKYFPRKKGLGFWWFHLWLLKNIYQILCPSLPKLPALKIFWLCYSNETIRASLITRIWWVRNAIR